MKKLFLGFIVILILLTSSCSATRVLQKENLEVKKDRESGFDEKGEKNQKPEESTGNEDSFLAAQREVLEAALPKEYSILDMCSGDLDLDGKNEIAIIIQRQQDGMQTERTIYLLKPEENRGSEKSDSWWLFGKNDCLIGDSQSGGAFGDSYSGMKLEDGTFTVELYGGSSFRWGETYTFGYDKEQKSLALVNMSKMAMNTETANGILTQTEVQKGICQTWTISSEEKFDGLLLAEQAFVKEEKELEFPKFQGLTDTTAAELYLPALDRYQYGTYTKQTVFKRTASEALEQVKETYFPELIKKNLDLGADILENYKQLFGISVPDYYNTDGTILLCFYGIADTEQGLVYKILKKDTYDIYEVLDATGEIISAPED